MSYDFYVELGGETADDIDALVRGEYRGHKINSMAARIQLLGDIAAHNPDIKDHAVSGDRKKGGGYKSLVHNSQNPQNTPYARELISPALAQLRKLEIENSTPDLSTLPRGSWFLQFTFTLAKPWMSKDDDPFYVTESVNPVRKDKVFKVPMMAASSWKGLLRWTAMYTRLAQKKDALTPKQFAIERFMQTLLFGDEKGEGEEKSSGMAAYLDQLGPEEGRKEARQEYERLLREHYKVEKNDPLPNHRGRLFFYPTFFDRIDVEVINPHSRETKAGTHPIYLECVPENASGTFSLLYLPFDMVGKEESEIREQAGRDLQLVAKAIKEMMRTYGFSAKRTSGYGTAQPGLKNGYFMLNFEETLTPPQPEKPPQQELPGYLAAPGRLKDEYLNPDGTFREHSPQELAAMKKKDRQQYKKARKWWEREGKALQAAPKPPQVEETLLPQPIRREFVTFCDLTEKADEIAATLTAGGAA